MENSAKSEKEKADNFAHDGNERMEAIHRYAFDVLTKEATAIRSELSAKRKCCVCGNPCPDNAPFDERWSWGPDGMHCHFACEDEFKRRMAWTNAARRLGYVAP